MCIEQTISYNCRHTRNLLRLHPGATERCEVLSNVCLPVDRDYGCGNLKVFPESP
jgi:hypothetical protein